MGFLVPILLAIGSLALDELGNTPSLRAPWAVFAMLLVPYLHARLRHRAALAGAFRRAAWLSRVERLLPVAMQYVAIGIFGWMRSLEAWFGTDLSILSWPEPAILLALLPYALYTLAAIDAETRMSGGSHGVRRHMRAFQLRMFLAGLAPILCYLLAASFIGRWDYLRIAVEEVSLWSLLFTVLLASSFVLLLPLVLKWTWETDRLSSGPQFDLLSRVAQLARFRCRELLVWKTGNLMSNAAIVGLFPSSRRVFFTDALLRQMGPRQLAAVFAHEIGHAKRYHVLIFLVWALAFFGLLDGLLTWAAFDDEALELSLLGAGLLLWLLSFGWLSRRVELDADLYCLELLRDGIGITSALQAVSPSDHSRSGWRHFSTRERVDFLGRASADPAVGRRLRRRLRVVALIGFLTLAGAGGWRLWTFAEAFPAERTLMDLRLGHFEGAARRLPGWAPGADEQDEKASAIQDLVRLAQSGELGDFHSRPEAAERCAEEARGALEADHAEAALGWLRLAELAGDHEAGRAAEALQGGLTGEPFHAADLGVWREPLEQVEAGGGALPGGKNR